jgi:hypothetical protein
MGSEIVKTAAPESLVAHLKTHGLPAAFAASLPRSIATALTFRPYTPEFDADQLLGLNMMEIRFNPTAAAPSQEDLAAGLRVVEASLKAGGPEACLAATMRMRVSTRQQQTVAQDAKLMLIVYAEKLANYPADAVAAACEKWLETSPWWPAIAEILPYCEWAMQPRRVLRVELMRAVGTLPKAAV